MSWSWNNGNTRTDTGSGSLISTCKKNCLCTSNVWLETNTNNRNFRPLVRPRYILTVDSRCMTNAGTQVSPI